MRDLFERFRRTYAKPGVTGVTGATDTTKPRDFALLQGTAAVAPRSDALGNAGNTRLSAERAEGAEAVHAATRDSAGVALLPDTAASWATDAAAEKTRQHDTFPNLLPVLPTLPVEGDAPGTQPSLAAISLRDTAVGTVWLVADEAILAEHVDIANSRLPVFLFDEIPHLANLDRRGLAAVATVKLHFPTARVLQAARPRVLPSPGIQRLDDDDSAAWGAAP